ncbi:MAG: DNA primase large subunit PriL [Candidatus Micrarchaeia archaeon]
MELAFCSKYPFTKEAKELVSSAKVSDEFRLVEMGKERVARAIKDGVIPTVNFELDESQILLQVTSYAISRMIVSILGSRYYINRYSVAEAKRAGRYLEGDTDENVLRVARELGIECEIDGDYSVGFEKYLKYAPKSVDYKLVNRKLKGGVVKLKRSEFIRLIEEAVKMKIESELPLRVENVPANIRKAAESVRASIPKEPVPAKIAQKGDFPPCIKKLLDDLKTVENLGHTARWALAVYLLNSGMSVDEVVRIFSTSPDFDERVTRYQVEHAQKRGYKMPSCASMDSNGLCVANCGVKNPLSYRRGVVGVTAEGEKP